MPAGNKDGNEKIEVRLVLKKHVSLDARENTGWQKSLKNESCEHGERAGSSLGLWVWYPHLWTGEISYRSGPLKAQLPFCVMKLDPKASCASWANIATHQGRHGEAWKCSFSQEEYLHVLEGRKLFSAKQTTNKQIIIVRKILRLRAGNWLVSGGIGACLSPLWTRAGLGKGERGTRRMRRKWQAWM